jgi:hypothetical protein
LLFFPSTIYLFFYLKNFNKNFKLKESDIKSTLVTNNRSY